MPKRVKVPCPGCGRPRWLRESSVREYALRGVTPTCHVCAWARWRRHGNATPAPAAEPTTARPGSPEKVAVMAARLERNEQLHHPADPTHPGGLRGMVAALREAAR